LGLASFSLGTDTAGSGRVPAMFNNLIGCKPSLGRLPATGVVPACRTLDTISIFALTAGDAAAVLAVAEGEDAADAYSRPMPPYGHNFGEKGEFLFGIPRAADLEFHGNADGPQLFADAVARLRDLGGTPVEIDLRPFRAVATLLYEGPWVAERYAAIRPFIEAQPGSLHPVTRTITEQGIRISAPDTFAALYKLKTLQKQTAAVWQGIACMVVPTASTIYTVAEVEADPYRLNSHLGHYTNFVNLLDLSAVAVPTGSMSKGDVQPAALQASLPGLPWGVTLIGPVGADLPLLSLAARLHALGPAAIGATLHAPHLGRAAAPDGRGFTSGLVRVAVCGAHLSGLPLNHQLTSRGARLEGAARTAPCYKLFALPGGPPWRPGLVRVGEGEGGTSIALEIWHLPASEFGGLVSIIPAPLGIGTVQLDDGSTVQGFLSESLAAQAGTEITRFGGWKAWLASMS
jgi:allophanate hydrolase